MIQSRVYLINSTDDRKWGEWLGPEFLCREIDRVQSLSLEPDTRAETCVVLVHGADDGDTRKQIQREYQALAKDRPDWRVWMLFYNGTGYDAKTPNLFPRSHWLRYGVPRRTTGQGGPTSLELASLRTAIAKIFKEPMAAPADIWPELYPPSNVRAVTLMALLASRHVGSVEVALGEYTRAGGVVGAHLEYWQACERLDEEIRLDRQTWQDTLMDHDYGVVENELRRVFGRAPD